MWFGLIIHAISNKDIDYVIVYFTLLDESYLNNLEEDYQKGVKEEF